jgi:hypothetical protein
MASLSFGGNGTLRRPTKHGLWRYLKRDAPDRHPEYSEGSIEIFVSSFEYRRFHWILHCVQNDIEREFINSSSEQGPPPRKWGNSG